uniref:Uncharacterized protein n=1 Tax=Arundo donax TaxID=35708 RepID=A0A0A9BUX1_ARUDO
MESSNLQSRHLKYFLSGKLQVHSISYPTFLIVTTKA